MKHRALPLFSALFFLSGVACFALLPWIRQTQERRFQTAEPYFRSPIPVYSDRLLLRNDAFGKGRFGASRGNGKRTHKGVDLLVKLGNAVSAAKSGRVVFAGFDRGYGWYVEILHPDGHRTRYAHLNAFYVHAGEWVQVDMKIGEAGKTGNARDPRIRPHLHFEIRENGEAVDPVKLMDPHLPVR